MPLKEKRRQSFLHVYNRTRGISIATEAVLADGYWKRLVGLLGKTSKWARLGAGLWIVPCHGVHTMGMLFPIDVIFIGKDKEVVRIDERLRPFRISAVCMSAKSILELPANTVRRTGTRVGDLLEISAADDGAPQQAEEVASASASSPTVPPEKASQVPAADLTISR